MGALVSTLLSLGTHADFLSLGSGVLCCPAMTYALKTHSSQLLRFVLALYPRGSFVLSCTAALHVDHLHLLALSQLHLDSCLSQLLTMTIAKSKLHTFDFYNLTHLDPWKEHTFECL